MKLKTILLLNEMSIPSFNMGSMTSNDTKLRAYPGSMDDAESWDGIKEGNGWFMYRGSNDWHSKRSGASVYITEGEPHKFWIKIKTHGLRKPNDTNESYRNTVKKHTDKVSRAWMTAARKIHNSPEINEVGNEIPVSWKQAFREALNDPKVKPYIDKVGEEKNSPIVDPVNFTPRI